MQLLKNTLKLLIRHNMDLVFKLPTKGICFLCTSTEISYITFLLLINS